MVILYILFFLQKTVFESIWSIRNKKERLLLIVTTKRIKIKIVLRDTQVHR